MIRQLMALYDDSLINSGQPKSMFAPTLIFNEGWLLRAVLKEWRAGRGTGTWNFLPFPEDARFYSEGQLYTPFGARYQGDKLAEKHSHADGVVGDFSISGSKSGIRLDASFRYLAVFEAKLSSPLASGTKNAGDYDQVARNVACMINMIMQSEPALNYRAYFIVIHPQGSGQVNPDAYGKVVIADQIARRISAYEGAAGAKGPAPLFVRQWRSILDAIRICFLTWEDALLQIGDPDLSHFYELCLQFS